VSRERGLKALSESSVAKNCKTVPPLMKTPCSHTLTRRDLLLVETLE
jgi:hypothetical protein